MTYSPAKPMRPWYSYSSRNKKGRRQDPLVYRRKDRALTMYWEQRPIEEIAIELNISEDTVWDYIRRGRKSGDPRADKRSDRKQSKRRLIRAEVRRRDIRDLSKQGLSAHEIAKRIGCHVSLVRKRLREASGA